jgi:hypothetical protein
VTSFLQMGVSIDGLRRNIDGALLAAVIEQTPVPPANSSFQSRSGLRPKLRPPRPLRRAVAATDSDPRSTDEADPRSAAVTFLTTEHFVLQGARAATIAESTGRANMFLGAVYGGLVSLGLVATASSWGAALYGFGLVLLPTLAFVTFERALQSSIEDTEYASRIALLRGYYFEQAPEIAPCLLSVAPAELLLMQRVPGDRWQGYRTVAGMVAVITGVLTGSTAALLAILIFDHSLAAAVISGAVVALPTLIAMIRHQDSAWGRAAAQPLGAGED